MDKLKEMLDADPCYEQHIVCIKELYEDYLFSILIPAIYDGFQSLYKRAFESEKKFIIASKKDPNIENPGILVIFQSFIKEIPNLNTHKIRNETDRIKSSTKSADVFDDLIKAVCKSNIILLTYNVDHKRKDLLKTKYHENVIIHDFIHDCYIHAARAFYGYAELFYHKQDPVILNQNKRTCHNIIREAIKEAIRLMLPMKEILLEYITQKYEQKDITPAIAKPNNIDQDEFIDINNMIDRDIKKYQTDEHSLLEDDYEPEAVIPEQSNVSLLLSGESSDVESGINGGEIKLQPSQIKDLTSSEHEDDEDTATASATASTATATASTATASDHGLKMIDISGAVAKKGPANTYFKEIKPDIEKRLEEYKQERKNKKEDIQITRSVSDKAIGGSISGDVQLPTKAINPAEKDIKVDNKTSIDKILKT